MVVQHWIVISMVYRHCLVANSVGDLARIDLRQGSALSSQKLVLMCVYYVFTAKVANRYKGFAGAISDISFNSDGTTFAACGLDRFLRVYRTHTPALLYKVTANRTTSPFIFHSSIDLSKATV